MLTKDQFYAKYRGRMLLFMTEAWAVRREAATDLGMTLDRHVCELRKVAGEMYDDLVPPKPAPAGATVKGPT